MVRARTQGGLVPCPRCGGLTGQVHGYCERTVADVPASGPKNGQERKPERRVPRAPVRPPRRRPRRTGPAAVLRNPGPGLHRQHEPALPLHHLRQQLLYGPLVAVRVGEEQEPAPVEVLDIAYLGAARG